MKRFLQVAVFSAGMTTLAVELTASRLLGSIFGTSNFVWASIIGLILLYLTAGYFIGGRWADRSPHAETFYTIIAWGAFTSGIVPIFARPVLRFAADAFDHLQIGVLLGSFVGVLILFCVPVTLLGTISPFAIRLSIDDPEHAGRISGRIYAISTIGSFVGTFLPVLLFIPIVGTAKTFLIFSVYLLLIAYIGLWQVGGWRLVLKWSWMLVLLAIAAAIGLTGTIKQSEGQIYETESAYNYIQVLERGDHRYLRLNDGQGIHSTYHPTLIAFDGPWMQFLAAPFFNPEYDPESVRSMAIVGLAAGTTARQATEVFGPILIDGFEIDGRIIQVGQEFFDMNQTNLNAIAVDGRWGLAHSENQYDIIAIDAYRPPYIPWHLTTQEFFKIAREHMTEQGVLVVNVGRAPDDRRLIDAIVGTIETLFPSIHMMDVPGSLNTIVYASLQPTRMDDLVENYFRLSERGDVHPVLLRSIQIAIENRVETPKGSMVLTDDRAPIEWIVNNMVFNFVLRGDIEVLR